MSPLATRSLMVVATSRKSESLARSRDMMSWLFQDSMVDGCLRADRSRLLGDDALRTMVQGMVPRLPVPAMRSCDWQWRCRGRRCCLLEGWWVPLGVLGAAVAMILWLLAHVCSSVGMTFG